MAEFLKAHKLLSRCESESENDLKTEIKSDVCSEDVLKGKVTALFFSASWCPPCQEFLPKLKTFYTELSQNEIPFEIVFISLDHTKDLMDEYYSKKHGNWLALPFDNKFKEEIIDKYHIQSIPKLVVIRESGGIITLKGRKDIQDKGVACFRNWFSNFIPKEDLKKPKEEAHNVPTEVTSIAEETFDTETIQTISSSEVFSEMVQSQESFPESRE